MPRGFLVKRMRRESPVSYRIRLPQEDNALPVPLPTDTAPRKGPKAGEPLGPQDWAQNPPHLVSAALLPSGLGRGPGSGSPVPGASAPSCAALSPGSGSACAAAARRAGGGPVEPAPEAGAPPGALVCQLCQEAFPGPLALAQHCCARIARVEYRCQECSKAFSCPANLASHRRWHKPRAGGHAGGTKENERPPPAGASPATPRPGAPEGSYRCSHCPRRFRRRAYLGKHLALHTASGPVLSESQQLQRNRGPQCGSCPKKPF